MNILDYFGTEEFKQLLEKYENVRNQNGSFYFDCDDLVDIGEYYLGNHQFNEALDLAEYATTMHPDSRDFLPIMVESQINLSRFDEARSNLAKMSPEEDYDYYYFWGQLTLADSGEDEVVNYEPADKYFSKWLKSENRVCEQDHDDLILNEAYFHIIASYSELAKNIAALDRISYYVDQYLKNCKFESIDDIDLEIARICHEENLVELEITLYEKFLDVNPYIKDGLVYLASLQNLNGRYEDSIESLKYSLAINPDDMYAVQLQGHNYYAINQYEKALRYYHRCMKNFEEPTLWNVIGKCYIMTGNRSEGKKALIKASKFYLKHKKDYELSYITENLMCTADSLFRGDFPEEAMNVIDNVLLLEPDKTDALIFRGTLYLNSKNYDEADYWYDKALESTSRKVYCHMRIGTECLNLGYINRALFSFRDASLCTEEENHIEAYPYIAYVYYNKGDLDNFCEFIDLACHYTPQTVYSFWQSDLENISEENYAEILKYKCGEIANRLENPDKSI